MKILIVDDEWAARQELERIIGNVINGPDIHTTSDAEEAFRLSAHNKFDIVFLDLQLPDTDGLTLARRLLEANPKTNIIIQTANPQFALEAFQLYVCDFLVKPVTEKDIRRALQHLRYPVDTELRKLRVQCFGNFEVYWEGMPLHFGRRKSKELFAYIIDRDCSMCTIDELATVLWEEGTDPEAAKTYIRRLVTDLRKSLNPLGLGDLLIRRRGQLGLDKEMLDCDYYRYLGGDPGSADSFHGEYMSQYSWASDTEGKLYFESRSVTV